MLSTIARRSSAAITTTILPRAMVARNFGIGDTLKGKEKVEEDRYMREQEKLFFAKKKAELADKLHGEEEKVYRETIAPAMAEAEQVLKKAGADPTTISHKELEAIAKWKLGMS